MPYAMSCLTTVRPFQMNSLLVSVLALPTCSPSSNITSLQPSISLRISSSDSLPEASSLDFYALLELYSTWDHDCHHSMACITSHHSPGFIWAASNWNQWTCTTLTACVTSLWSRWALFIPNDQHIPQLLASPLSNSGQAAFGLGPLGWYIPTTFTSMAHHINNLSLHPLVWIQTTIIRLFLAVYSKLSFSCNWPGVNISLPFWLPLIQ